MDTQKTFRKPYHPQVKRTWWMSKPAYIKYMVRELTSIFSLWIAVELLIICILAALMMEDAQQYISGFIQNPVVIILNIISLIAVLFHAVTWFNIMPKAVRIFRSKDGSDTRMLPAKFWIALLWGVTCVASVIIPLVLIYA